MNKYTAAAVFILMLLPLALASAQPIVGTHKFVITMGAWEKLQGISLDPDNRIAYISISAGKPKEGNPVITTTEIPENFEFAPTAVTSIVVIENSTTMDPAKYSVVVGVNGNTIKYDVQLPTTPMISYSTVTTVITNIITVPTTTIKTLSWNVFYPAYPVDAISINIKETGYYAGISIGHYTVITDEQGNISTVYIPTVPAERNIVIIWDPVNDKIISGQVTVSDMVVLPAVAVETVLGSTYTVTRNATIVDMTIGEFVTQTDIGMTRDGYNSYAVFIVYHNGSPELTTYILPDALRGLINYMQAVKYGSETIQWQGDGANARPIIIVPYTATFLTDTFTGNATMYFDDKHQEYVIYNAVYTKTIYDSLMGVFTGTFNFTLHPGQWIGGIRYATPLTTSYTDVILITKTEYTTTTFVVVNTGAEH